jgi:hypothetical protein
MKIGKKQHKNERIFAIIIVLHSPVNAKKMTFSPTYTKNRTREGVLFYWAVWMLSGAVRSLLIINIPS